MQFQTYLKDCECTSGGIILYNGKAVCRWCRKPYGEGGNINYETEHFKQQPSKDWEIVSFIDHCTTNPDGTKRIVEWKDYYQHCTKEEWLNNWLGGGFKIESVRRISDNLVFKVDGDSDKGLITKFEIVGNEMCVYTVNPHRSWYYLNQIKGVKPKLPLFTTEDGVEVFEGEKYYYVDANWHIHSFTPKLNVKFDTVESRTFWHKENLDQFILENKPIQVSYKELENVINKKYGYEKTSYEAIKAFFKSKIQP